MTAHDHVYAESVLDWDFAILMTGLSVYPVRGMPESVVQFASPFSDKDFAAEIGEGAVEARRLQKAEPGRLVAETTGGKNP